MIWLIQLICIIIKAVCESIDSSISLYISVNGETKKKRFGVNSDSQIILSFVFLCCLSGSSKNFRSSVGSRICNISDGSRQLHLKFIPFTF
jgi:hypothetical protein